MLKRLELIGFKSFADKTQFDFSAGITAIVGPNGSGKSNVVDAVRWILGEQSAKSLRGGEMADVIFNGSTSRRGLGMAEVTMTFDNGRRLLATPTDEVQITRRVYRGGEGEYLINQQICRLKDIKDLFLGSGAGSDAYCIIEQGRVDVLLQASTKDRRTIFEEAAGISRFKAKKVETLRKLERVDQNLLRLRDIVDEVDKQLRSVKLQASKAQRYQEYSVRLKGLRVGLGLTEFRDLTAKLDVAMAALEQLKLELAERGAEVDAWDAAAARLDEDLARLDERIHEEEGLLADARQQIAAEEATLTHERALSADLEVDLAATRQRLNELGSRVSTLAQAASAAAVEVQGAEALTIERRRSVEELDDALQAAVLRLEELRSQIQTDKAEHLEQMRQAARLHNDSVSYRAQLDNLRRERDRLVRKTEQAVAHLASLDTELTGLIQADQSLQTDLAGARNHIGELRLERDSVRERRDHTQQQVADLRADQSGLASRMEVLERLERSHEGLGTGVREMIALLDAEREAKRLGQQEGKSDEQLAGSLPWQANVLGMVADFLTVRREYAPLIDLVLGERAQRFLVRDPRSLETSLGERNQPFSGRVGFVPIAPAVTPLTLGSLGLERTRPDAAEGVIGAAPAPSVTTTHHSPLTTHHVDLLCVSASPREFFPSEPCPIANAADLVSCDQPELHDLPRRLLGDTLIVSDLATARRLADRHGDYRFVTLAGEVVEADGSLTVGTHHGGTGILSRKSELRELRVQAAALDASVAEAETTLAEARERLNALDARAAALQQDIDARAEQAADLRSRIGQRRETREELNDEVAVSRREIAAVETDIQKHDEAWQRAQSQAEQADGRVASLQARLEAADREIREQEQIRQRRQQEVTAAKVTLAQVEERLAALVAKHRQLQSDHGQRSQEHRQGEQHLAAAQVRLDESQRTMLRASSLLAGWYLQKEAAERAAAVLSRQRDALRHERQTHAERAQVIRAEWRARQDSAHTHELEASDLRHRRATLADRLREDYQIELAELYEQSANVAPSKPLVAAANPADGAVPAVDGQAGGEAVVFPVDTSARFDLGMSPQAANDEIAELRKKLTRLGSVNLDSLQELAELETRSATLQTQSDDLNAAKRSLEEIIATINQDSRRLFADAFAAIRTHFQELFRKLFGGGMADIFLEDEADILESGVEIIARPPGKELRSISLMSGGEKTLTAVALLLAIFRSKPSPFCILDEVDAALDEANIGRFTAVLREFLEHSQFIIITHSKRTMGVADVLYGVTMQESGVSKRVAVRFEDWLENGRAAAPEPAETLVATPAAS